MLATTASVAIGMLGGSQEGLVNLRENIKALRAQLEGRSEWVRGTSEEGNAVQIFVVKEEVCRARGLGVGELEGLVGEFLDEVCSVLLYFPFLFSLLGMLVTGEQVWWWVFDAMD